MDMKEIVNAHIHLFDSTGENKYYNGEKCIGFADMNDPDVDYRSLYDNYISTHKINGGLLATGSTTDEMIGIKNDNLGIIKGYGEIKLFKGDKYDYDRDDFKKLLDYNEDHENLPIMFHYDMIGEDHLKEVKSYIEQYPNTKFIHCHCGCPGSGIVGDTWAIVNAMQLSRQYDNYYVDISWSATDLLEYYAYRINNAINVNKILLGTDTNIDMDNVLPNPREYVEKRMNQFKKQGQMFGLNSNHNVKVLFNV